MHLKIAHTDPQRLAARSQTTTAQVTEADTYDSGALVPGRQWQQMTAEDCTQLQPNRHTHDRALVELVALPPGVAPRRFSELSDVLGDSRARYVGHYTSAPGLLTTTPDSTSGRFVGLHVDNFDRLSYPHRHLSRRRLCFNLGPGRRYLLLGRRSILGIARDVHPDFHQRCPHTDDLRAYVAAGRALPLLRIRLDPGEGYIAPTELLPHDGSTIDAEQPSTAAFWLGTWPSGRLPSLV